MGLENNAKGEVNPGLGLASCAGHPLFRELLEEYRSVHFVREDGSLNFHTVVAYTTAVMQRHGPTAAETVCCVDGIYLYPDDYFCPFNYRTRQLRITENTRSIHHFAATWKKITWKARLANAGKKILGPSITEKILDAKARQRERKAGS